MEHTVVAKLTLHLFTSKISQNWKGKKSTICKTSAKGALQQKSSASVRSLSFEWLHVYLSHVNRISFEDFNIEQQH